MKFRSMLPLVAVLAFGSISCSAETTKAEPAVQGSEPKQAASATPSATSDTKVMIALDGEGLRLVNVESGSARLLAFGTDRVVTESAITDRFGAYEGRSSNDECGAGPIHFSHYGDFTANFQNGQFVGWSLRDGDKNADLTTMSGVGIGTKRSEMVKSVTYEMYEESSIGIEFYTGGDGIGGFSGLFEDDMPDAKIIDLWAGTNCIFR